MKKIPGVYGYYITKSGVVWSYRPPNGRGTVNTPRKLKIRRDKDGYWCTNLESPTGSKRMMIHRLLLLTYVGPCPNGMECCHKNDNKDDNRLKKTYIGEQESKIQQTISETVGVPTVTGTG